jgi:lipoyl(octanoyl) transferase
MELPIKIQSIVFAKKDYKLNILLLKRVPEDGGFWQTLTETLEEGEMIKACIKRGLKEEIGVRNIINITDKVHQFYWNNKFGEPNIDLVYGVEIDSKEKITINTKEHSEYKWCSVGESLQLLKFETNKESIKKLVEML